MKKWYIVSCSVSNTSNAQADSLYLDYTQFFNKCGISIVPLSNVAQDVAPYFNDLKIKGVIFTGGNDLGARLTGEKDTAYIVNASPARDRQETRLIDIAVKKRIPVLGICRGMQFINCYFGGRLTRDIRTFIPGAVNHIRASHELDISDKKWRSMFGNRKIIVNSYHHQGVTEEQTADDLEIIAVSKGDGIVEALCHKYYPIAGIQWHPERSGCASMVNEIIMDSFIKCTGYWSAKRKVAK